MRPMMPTAQAVLAAVILLAVIGAVLAFAVWIGRMVLRDYRELQRLDANYERWELAESINNLKLLFKNPLLPGLPGAPALPGTPSAPIAPAIPKLPALPRLF